MCGHVRCVFVMLFSFACGGRGAPQATRVIDGYRSAGGRSRRAPGRRRAPSRERAVRLTGAGAQEGAGARGRRSAKAAGRRRMSLAELTFARLTSRVTRPAMPEPRISPGERTRGEGCMSRGEFKAVCDPQSAVTRPGQPRAHQRGKGVPCFPQPAEVAPGPHAQAV